MIRRHSSLTMIYKQVQQLEKDYEELLNLHINRSKELAKLKEQRDSALKELQELKAKVNNEY